MIKGSPIFCLFDPEKEDLQYFRSLFHEGVGGQIPKVLCLFPTVLLFWITRLINPQFRILFALLAGTWSDKYGRKPLIFLAVLGQLLASVSYGVNYWFLTQLNWQWLYLELINDFCGTYVSYYIAEYSFITDITGITDR